MVNEEKSVGIMALEYYGGMLLGSINSSYDVWLTFHEEFDFTLAI